MIFNIKNLLLSINFRTFVVQKERDRTLSYK
uniref:Uncharacterized protein n=1 Tax=Myoviridae sp. ctkmZ20 TaxID=2825166 RepID=A0A8S5NUL6_9CAUD|nr:MAG TPA: hypothetical protein [Myoviridae sp. ctkmZ20]